MSSSKPPIPRTVRPRKPYTLQRSLLVATGSTIYSESHDAHYNPADLPDLLREHESAYLLCADSSHLLAGLHRHFRDHRLWQFRLTPIERERWHLDGTITKRPEVIVNFCGFMRRTHRERNRYFYPLSPSQFCRQSAQDLVKLDVPYWEKLFLWGDAVRTFCTEYDLRPSPTAGGIATQLLRHPLFYGEDRRKVPTATNERVRPHLPGNYYELTARRSLGTRLARKAFDPVRRAFYIDQEDAHHFAALNADTPHPDHLRARGWYREERNAPWVRRDGPGWASLMSEVGLLYASVFIPPVRAARPFLPPAMRQNGHRMLYLYTNEVREIESLGATIEYVSAAWTSTRRDEGLRRYAEWARGEVKARPDDAPWLKPTVLAAYGVLAAKPRQLESTYWQANGERSPILIGPELIDVVRRQSTRRMQSPTANVIQRGIIEAETRIISLRLARDLHARKFDVLSIYADAVIVRDNGKPLPLIEKPWRVKKRLHNLEFLNETSFRSREIIRLPGVPRDKQSTKGGRKWACSTT